MDGKDRPVSPVNGQPIPQGKPFTTSDERARQAGKVSGKRRKERKTLREELLLLLMSDVKDEDSGRKVQTQTKMSSALVDQALKGNTKAYEIIRDTIGEKPVEKVEQMIDVDYRKSVEYVRSLMEEKDE